MGQITAVAGIARIVTLLWALVAVGLFTGFTYPPAPSSGVNDYARVLNAEQKVRLEERLRAFYQRTGNQSLIAIFPSLDGEPVENVATELFKRWGIGTKKENNGLLLVISIQDRALRIETGYGLEEKIPDALAGRIIRNDIVPFFKQGQYFTGLIAYQARVDEIFGGEATGAPLPRERQHRPRGVAGELAGILILVFIIWVLNRPRRYHRSITGHGRINTPWIDTGLGGLGGWTIGRGSRNHSSSGGGFGDWFGGGGGLSGGGGASGRW